MKLNNPLKLNKDGVLFLNLTSFKTQPCTRTTPHNPMQCFHFHDAMKDRRRPLGTYTSMMCENLANCLLGAKCPHAHNTVEDFYHPEKYKSKFCQYFPHKIAACKYGDLCAFAHNEDELSVPKLHLMEQDTDFYLFHFKTVWCPFSHTDDKTHPRESCVYAHNWQDFRRKVHIYNYSGD